MSRVFSPLGEHHPLVTEAMECPGCRKAFQAGDITVLVTIGPGDDEDARVRAGMGRPYNAVALPAHQLCVHGYAAEGAAADVPVAPIDRGDIPKGTSGYAGRLGAVQPEPPS